MTEAALNIPPFAGDAIVQAKGLRKAYGDVNALDGFDMTVPKGRILGLIGPNGSGKTTALKSLLGLASLDAGELSVVGMDPRSRRAELMRHVAFIADTGILPRWMKVSDLLDYVDRVHPRFDREVAEQRLQQTQISMRKKVSVLSKGMHVQLHLAIILAIGADLLVLDEPTLGLDILYRQQFYDAVLGDYFDESRSIIVTTHEVREIEHILTDVVFIHQGRARLSLAMDEIPARFAKLISAGGVGPEATPLYAKQGLGGTESIYCDVDLDHLRQFGEVHTPNLAELFVAVVQGGEGVGA